MDHLILDFIGRGWLCGDRHGSIPRVGGGWYDSTGGISVVWAKPAYHVRFPGVTGSFARDGGYTKFFRDITDGSYGDYSAKPGYDLVTGIGSMRSVP
jgi:hypothetical protein